MKKISARKQHMTRADAILLLLCLFAAAAFALWFAVGRKEGGILLLTCDGEVVDRSSLREFSGNRKEKAALEKVRYCLLLYTEEGVLCEWYDAEPDLPSTVPEGISYNLLSVSSSGVFMEAADCPDQICVHHIPIMRDGESIICLPHRLAVEIRDEKLAQRQSGS